MEFQKPSVTQTTHSTITGGYLINVNKSLGRSRTHYIVPMPTTSTGDDWLIRLMSAQVLVDTAVSCLSHQLDSSLLSTIMTVCLVNQIGGHVSMEVLSIISLWCKGLCCKMQRFNFQRIFHDQTQEHNAVEARIESESILVLLCIAMSWASTWRQRNAIQVLALYFELGLSLIPRPIPSAC